MILSIGYRVKSRRRVEFRQRANQVLKEYLLKGYSINRRIEQLEKRLPGTTNESSSSSAPRCHPSKASSSKARYSITFFRLHFSPHEMLERIE